jgi:hypothetical protein
MIVVFNAPAGQRRERFSFAEIHVLKHGNRPSDGVNRSEFLQILLRKIAHGVARRGRIYDANVTSATVLPLYSAVTVLRNASEHCFMTENSHETVARIWKNQK